VALGQPHQPRPLAKLRIGGEGGGLLLHPGINHRLGQARPAGFGRD
jgi:hypothetical protein